MKDNESLQAAQPASPTVPPRETPPRRILVVNNDPDMRRLTSEVLILSGYEVHAVGDVATAWYNLHLHGYDLMVADYDLPFVSGFELLTKVRAARMALPVIVAAGKMPREEFDNFPWLQPALTLLHPFTSDEFLETVQEALRVPGKLLWDSKNMRFTNSEEANKYLKPFTRKGWELKV